MWKNHGAESPQAKVDLAVTMALPRYGSVLCSYQLFAGRVVMMKLDVIRTHCHILGWST